MKELKFIEGNILRRDQLNDIQGGIKNPPTCFEYTVVQSCYYKNSCPIFSTGTMNCRNFTWLSDNKPTTIVTIPSKKTSSED